MTITQQHIRAKRIFLLAFILLVGCRLCLAQSVEKQIDSVQLSYYRWCTRHATDPMCLLKADTLFQLAGRQQNRRMQAVALCLKADHYYFRGELDSLKANVDRARQFTKRYDQPPHYFSAWSRLILFYAKRTQYTFTQYELNAFLKEAKESNYKPAIVQAYKLMGQIYTTRGLVHNAADAYQKAISYVEEEQLKDSNISYLYLQLAQLDISLGDYEQARILIEKAEKAIPLPENIWRVRMGKVRLLAWEGKYAESEQLLDQVELHSKGLIPKNALQELRCLILKETGRYAQALQVENQILDQYQKTGDIDDPNSELAYLTPTIYTTRAEIYAGLNQYKNAYLDLQKSTKLQRILKQHDSEQAFEELTALLDVDRLNREKSEAQRLTQIERSRRLQTLGITLSVILLLAALLILVLVLFARHLIHAKQKAEAASRMKSIFIRTITHEINTPLNAIVGFSELAGTSPIEEDDRRSYLDLVHENSRYLQKIVDDMLYISDLESSDTPPATELVDLRKLCQEAIRLTINELPAAQQIEFAAESPAYTLATSHTLVLKILRELLHNAVRFSGSGQGVTLGYTIANNGRHVTFTVTDCGAGIPADAAKRIFDRFVKLDTFSQGMGLGLSVCNLIVNVLHGSIALDSTYTEGARFTVTIPDANSL